MVKKLRRLSYSYYLKKPDSTNPPILIFDLRLVNSQSKKTFDLRVLRRMILKPPQRKIRQSCEKKSFSEFTIVFLGPKSN